MTERPPLGAHVRLRSRIGPQWTNGASCIVVAHHQDGIAFVIECELFPFRLVCDPSDVDLCDAQPARVGGGE